MSIDFFTAFTKFATDGSNMWLGIENFQYFYQQTPLLIRKFTVKGMGSLLL